MKNYEIKSLISLIIALIMTTNFFVFDATAYDRSSKLSSGNSLVVPLDNSRPSQVWNLATDGQYYLSGKATGKATLYSLYLFTGVDPICIGINNYGSKSLTVELIKDSLLDTTVKEFTVAAGDTKVVTVDVSKSKKYYLSFSSPCDFDGWIL